LSKPAAEQAIEADNEGLSMTRTWLITDASSRFGRELARTVLASGDGLVAAARRPEQLDDLVQEYGDGIRAVPLDVTDGAAARDAVQVAVDTFGALDVVVNNAGYSVSRIDVTEDDFLFGVVNVTKAALPVLRRQRSGHYIQFSSRGGRGDGVPGLGVYEAAKSVIEAFSEVLNTEVKPFGIKVTIVEPNGFGPGAGGLPVSTVRAVKKTASRTVHAVKNDESSIRWMVRYHASRDRTQQGDPARGARVIRDIVRLDEPPLYLLLASEKPSDSTSNRVRGAQRLRVIGHEQ
jgi:NAD(P)-dependent dehydrogenase (short-subunit alcohol dehydrogenase family)